MRRAIVLLGLAAALLHAQPAFEVASLKPATSTEPGWMLRVFPGGRLHGERITFQQLVTVAYDLQKHQVTSSLTWLGAERYDLEATAGHPAGEPELRLMLQTLIADQFHLRFHRETREMTIYNLVQAKNGVASGKTIHESPSGDCGKMTTPNPAQARSTEPTACGGESVTAGNIVGHRTTLDELATNLAIMVERLVINKTGLEGSYDLTLTWTPDQVRGTDDNGLSLFTAVKEQLGLKLEAGRGPVDVLVVDSAQKPSEH
jgi:uncharacterized protein (TIGR03435 family)